MKIKLHDGTEMEVITPEEVTKMLEDTKVNTKKEVLDEIEKNKKVEPPKVETPPKTEPPKVEDEKVNVKELVDKEINKIKTEESFKGFSTKLGKVEGFDVNVLAGLAPNQYDGILSLVENKKKYSEEEMNKLIDEKATEKAKKILEDNGKPKHDENAKKLSDIKNY